MLDKISIFLLTENRLVREALVRIFGHQSDLHVVRAASLSSQIVSEIAASDANILISDTSTNILSELEIVPELHAVAPDLRVLMIGMEAGPATFLRAEWGKKNITTRFPNFRFVHADVFNKHYNPRGRLSPAEFRFPFADAEFDFVFLKSVFTHLLPDTIAHYLCEIHRVLKPGGTCLATLFLLNDASTELIQNGRASIPLPDQLAGCRVSDAKFPETAVAVAEEDFVKRCDDNAMSLKGPIYYGSWCGRPDYLSFQDVVVLQARATTRGTQGHEVKDANAAKSDDYQFLTTSAERHFPR